MSFRNARHHHDPNLRLHPGQGNFQRIGEDVWSLNLVLIARPPSRTAIVGVHVERVRPGTSGGAPPATPDRGYGRSPIRTPLACPGASEFTWRLVSFVAAADCKSAVRRDKGSSSPRPLLHPMEAREKISPGGVSSAQDTSLLLRTGLGLRVLRRPHSDCSARLRCGRGKASGRLLFRCIGPARPRQPTAG